MILRVLNLILIVITFGLVEIIDTVTYDEIDNNITVTGYEDYTYREVFGDSLYGIGKTNLIDNGDFSTDLSWWTSVSADDANGYVRVTDEKLHIVSITGVNKYIQKNILTISNTYYICFDYDFISGDGMGREGFDFTLPALVDGSYSYIDDAITISLAIKRLGITEFKIDNLLIYDLTELFRARNKPTIEQFGEMKTEYERMLALQPYEQVTTTRNTLDMTDLIISLVSLLCWYGVIKVWKGVRK